MAFLLSDMYIFHVILLIELHIVAMRLYIEIFCVIGNKFQINQYCICIIYITLPGQPGDIWGVINLIFHT